jgi:hypothetical protein
VFSVGSSVVALASLLLMSWVSPSAPRGLLEHLATVVLSVWLLVFAGRLVSAESAAARGPGILGP